MTPTERTAIPTRMSQFLAAIAIMAGLASGAVAAVATSGEADIASPGLQKPSAQTGPPALTLAPTAAAAPSGTSSVEQTVNQLNADGYTVIVNKVGAAPADQCTVAAVRAGGTAHPLARGTSTERVPSFPFKNWR